MTDQRLQDRNGEPIEDADGFLLPHYRTFAAVWNTFTQTYRYTWDEAIKHSPANALSMRRDAFITGCLQERYLQVAQLAWHLEPESVGDPDQSAVAAALTDILKATDRWHHFTMQLAEAIWYGRFANQVRWDAAVVNSQTRLVITDHRPVNGDKIQFGFDGTPRVMVHAADATKLPGAADAIIFGDRGPMLELKDPRWRQRFVIHKHIPNDADYFEGEFAGGVHGVGLRSLIYWLWWLRDEMLGWAVNHLKKIGVGGILIFYYEEGNAASKTAAEAAAQDAGDRYALAMPRPRGSSKDVAHAEMLPFNEAGVQSLTTVVSDYFERHIERLIIGQSLSSKAEGTGMGSSVADLHADTKFRILKFDAENLADTLTRDLVAVAQRWNFPGLGFRVRLVFDIPQPDAKDKLDAATKLYSMKVPLRANDIRGAAGFGKPQPGEEVIQQQTQQAAPAQSPNPELQTSADLDDSDDDDANKFQGLGPIEYAKSKWVKFDGKGIRIDWSQSDARPGGPGWEPYAEPKRESNETESKSGVKDDSAELARTNKFNARRMSHKQKVELFAKKLSPGRFAKGIDAQVTEEIATHIAAYENGKMSKKRIAIERIVAAITGLRSDEGHRFWDHYGLHSVGDEKFIILLDSKLTYSEKGTARDKQARMSAHKQTPVLTRMHEALEMGNQTGLPVRAGYVCYVNGEGLDEDLKERRGWYFVPAHHFEGELSLRKDKDGVIIPLMTGRDVSLRSLNEPGKAQELSQEIQEAIMKIDRSALRKEMEQATAEERDEQIDIIASSSEGEHAMTTRLATTETGKQAMLKSLGISEEQYEQIQRLNKIKSHE